MEWWTSDVVDYEDHLISPKDDPFPLGLPLGLGHFLEAPLNSQTYRSKIGFIDFFLIKKLNIGVLCTLSPTLNKVPIL